jgi:erythromycin esterase-like protein
VGFYGLDVYSLWASMIAVVSYLDRVDPAASDAARRAYECFAPYGEDERAYARATLLVPHDCRDEVARVLSTLVSKAPRYVRDAGREAHFDAEQNALVARDAEHYYRTMISGGAASWNVRDDHMADTLDRLVALHGPDTKCIVWAHNTHVGDARFTDMIDDGERNLGQIVRERHGEDDTVLVGFTTHHGSVIAARAWDAPFARMRVPEARPGSVEDTIHRAVGGDALFVLRDLDGALDEARGQRAIGVVYHPEYERFGNYVPTVLPRRYDALLHVDETHALAPLHPEHPAALTPDTYPSGM